MCIAILKPKGKKLHREVLEESFRCNRDGAGFAFFDEEKGAVFYKKGFFDFDSFWKSYEAYQEHKCLIHFRVATHKNVDSNNCHPWRVNKNLVFIHNGRIAGMDKNDALSDTGNFCVMLGELLEEAPNYYKTASFKWFVANAIGSGNKLVFLDSSGDHIIINEEAGNWKDGVWFSNTSYSCTRSRETGVLTDEFYPPKPPAQTLALPPATTPPNHNTESDIPVVLSGDLEPAKVLAEIKKNGSATVDVASETVIDKLLAEVNALQFSRPAFVG